VSWPAWLVCLSLSLVGAMPQTHHEPGRAGDGSCAGGPRSVCQGPGTVWPL
jgi:hypothetical protein